MKKISSGVLLLLLYDSLLAQYTNLKFENLSTIDGLSSSTCVEIHQDQDGFLWFGTIDGLNKYDGYEFIIYRSVISDPHSISSNRIYCIEEDNLGRLWIGTGNGLTVARRIILKESIIRTKAIALNYDEDYISFEYLALNYNNPEKNRYAYRMKGLDKDWNYVGNKRSASYSNLAPGDYVFEVMASTDDVWDANNKAALAISILPPPWKTWWAYTVGSDDGFTGMAGHGILHPARAGGERARA